MGDGLGEGQWQCSGGLSRAGDDRGEPWPSMSPRAWLKACNRTVPVAAEGEEASEHQIWGEGRGIVPAPCAGGCRGSAGMGLSVGTVRPGCGRTAPASRPLLEHRSGSLAVSGGFARRSVVSATVRAWCRGPARPK